MGPEVRKALEDSAGSRVTYTRYGRWKMNRRQILMGLPALVPALVMAPSLLGLLARPAAAQAELREGERFLGEADAPVTIIEYASLTCPHCARFHLEILPQVREEWVDSGRANLVFRHFPLDSLALRAAMVAEAMPSDRAFFAFLNVLFDTQAQWSRAEDPFAVIARHAQLAGMSEEKFQAALEDEPVMNEILEGFVEARDELDVNSTPTLIVNGKKIVGVSDYESFATALEEAHAGS